MSKRTPIDPRRIREVRPGPPAPGGIVYWMSREQRVQDNWALLYAQEWSVRLNRPIAVIFSLVPSYLGATSRQYHFMLEGLRETEQEFRALGIPFFLLIGQPDAVIPRFVVEQQVGLLVADCSPLRINRSWVEGVAGRVAIPVHQVDAHNIVPVWEVSDKQEWAAYTFRPKINRLLPSLLTEFPSVLPGAVPWPGDVPAVDWDEAHRSLRGDRSVAPVGWLAPGSKAAGIAAALFFESRLARYAEGNNDPNEAAESALSPYLHFGQLAPQRVALEAQRYTEFLPSQETFLEQLIVRRELSDNFCWYNVAYDSFAGLPEWGRTTLDEHRSDPREHRYGREEFETGRTHDTLWNAAQMEMVRSGKMHGYMRMYWAKKMLEWSDSPEEALADAIYLNDRYELDGRDPNGYTGIAWSIGGLHDRAWKEREVFGKIRFMSRSGCERKFDVPKYIARVNGMLGEEGR